MQQAESRGAYRAFSNYAEANYGSAFTYKLPMTEAFIGTFGILMHTPELGRAFLAFETAMHALPELTEMTRDIVTLVVASHEAAGYAMYANRRMAVANGALTAEQANDILSGRQPVTFGPVETQAQLLATELCRQR